MHRQPQRERRALAELALDADVAAEELREPPRDREPEPGAALHRIAARTGVHLLELLEDARLIARRDADAGVDDLQRDPRRDARRATARASAGSSGVCRRGERLAESRRADEPRANRDAAGRRVLHRVADEVHENLPQVRRIGAHARQRRADRDREARARAR